jgi:hypothetical protein
VGPAIAISVPRSAGSVIAELCQDIIAAAAEVRASVPLALEAMQTEHEADRTTSLTRLGQPDGISPSRMAEMLEVDRAGPKVRC